MSTDGRVSSDQVSSERRSGEIVLVAAVAANEVIGADGAMPWHLPEDLAHFKEVTMGHPMVMGRKTFEAIGRPLPGRRTIVVTRDRQWAHSGVQTAGDLDTALALAFEGVRAGPDPTGPVMVVGGGQIYEQAMPQATRLRSPTSTPSHRATPASRGSIAASGARPSGTTATGTRSSVTSDSIPPTPPTR